MARLTTKKTETNYTKDAKEHGKEVAVAKQHEVAFTDDDFATEDEILSTQNVIVPRITVLQGLSPQLDPHAPEYVKGATISNFCDVALGEVWEDLLIVPCWYADIYLEWAPRESGEGLIANYGTDSTKYDATPPNEKQQRFTKEGNQIIQTGTIFCLNIKAGGRPSFFPLSSTGYQAAKQFNTLAGQDKAQDSQGVWRRLKMSSRVYRVEAVQKVNKKGKWFIPAFKKDVLVKELDPTGELSKAAAMFAEKCRKGLVTADFAREDESGAPHDENGSM